MATNEETFTTSSPAGTAELGRKIAARLRAGDCVAMTGDLGAGKTALVRGIAAGLGLDDDRIVSSPTYVLVQEYPASMPVYHLDLYRMGAPEAELGDLGLEEMLADGVVLIEWAERAAAALPRPRWELSIAITSRRGRRFTLRRVE
jgi:tRNA threonylcarbamoyladenosine biosynthesis protein TsaE